MNQSDLAERLEFLGHDWSRQTVSDIERSHRNVTLDELFALSMALEVATGQLLDPAGIEGRSLTDLDFHPDSETAAFGIAAHHWAYSRTALGYREASNQGEPVPAWYPVPVPGHEAAAKEIAEETERRGAP